MPDQTHLLSMEVDCSSNLQKDLLAKIFDDISEENRKQGESLILAIVYSLEAGTIALQSYLKTGVVKTLPKDLMTNIEQKLANISQTTEENPIKPVLENLQPLIAFTFDMISRAYLPLKIELRINEKNLFSYFRKVFSARNQITQRDFTGTTDKFINALVGATLHGTISNAFLRDYTLRTPEKTPDERLERWRNIDITTAPKLRRPERRVEKQVPEYVSEPIHCALPHVSSVSAGGALGTRDRMEDASAIGVVEILGQQVSYFSLFDGHGGDNVSYFLKTTIPELIQQSLLSFQKPLEETTNAQLENVLSVLGVKAMERWLDSTDMHDYVGATILCVLFIQNSQGLQAWIANAGDSRALALQEELTYQLTEDANPSEYRFAKGGLSRGGTIEKSDVVIKRQPVTIHRLSGILAMTRAVGDQTVEGITARMKITHFPLTKPTTFIIACDGMFENSTSKEVANAYRNIEQKKSEDPAGKLIQYAFTRGSLDNISAIIVKTV
jgi:serine/threonine protein phosphatase PrpC